MEAAERLAAIAAIVEQVALLLHHHASLLAGEKTDGKMVGERAGGDPYGGLLTEGGGDGLFELADHSSTRIIIGLDGWREVLQKSGVFRGRVVHTVAVGLHRNGISTGGCGCGGSKDGGGEECSAVHGI